MTKLRVMVRVVCVNVEYETCKCKYNYMYMILCIYLKQYKKYDFYLWLIAINKYIKICAL